jgi:phosphatidylinositol alpha-1,6-mannosyltransferase
VNHLFVTQDYGPDRGGMARRHVELCRRIADSENSVAVSTVQLEGAREFDRGENYRIDRRPFHFREANRFTNQVRWAWWLSRFSRKTVDILHCGNIRPVGYAVDWATSRHRIPYIVYVNGGDLLREKKKTQSSPMKRFTARRILGRASGIAATSRWVAELTGEVMQFAGVTNVPPIAALDLGTDPEVFSPSRNTGRLRAEWGIGDAPVLLTVARLVPHKGQDVAIKALAALSGEFPDARYVLAGEGHDEQRLRSIASDLGVAGRVIFAGAVSDADLPEVYAMASVYVGPSRIDNEVNAEGFGISFLEASASGVPVVAGDSGGVRSAVRDGETGVVAPPENVEAIANAVATFLRDEERRRLFGEAGRRAVETHYNWDRVARETKEFALEVTADRRRAP